MEWITTAATVALAATAFLAYRSNRRLIAASEDQLDAARATVARQLEPRLLPGDPEAYRVGDQINTDVGPQTFSTRRVYIPLENAGPGLAFIHKADVSSSERGTFNVWAPPVIPAGAQSPLRLAPHGGTALDLPAGERFKVSIAYSGVDAVARELRFTAQRFPGEDWDVHIVAGEKG